MCSKQAAGLTSSDSTTTQVTATGNIHPEVFVNDGVVDVVEAVDDVSAANNSVETYEDVSDDEDNNMQHNDLTTKSSTSKNRERGSQGEGPRPNDWP